MFEGRWAFIPVIANIVLPVIQLGPVAWIVPVLQSVFANIRGTLHVVHLHRAAQKLA
jgi:hypothetical protein